MIDDGKLHAAELGKDQVNTLIFLERIGGTVSLISVLLIFIAYALVPRVRNVQNTFIVFASISNVGASVASIISFEGIRHGRTSALCQGQGFLFEMWVSPVFFPFTSRD